MIREVRDIVRLMGVLLMAVMLLSACSGNEELAPDPNQPAQLITARLNFSLPGRIVSRTKANNTRMTGDVVQESGKEEDFRGLDDVHLLCFNQYPTQNAQKLGGVIDMKTSGKGVSEEATQEDYSLSQEINIPVGTSYFAFYGRAADAPTTHEERMHYGTSEAVGLSKSTYQGNNAIRIRPVQICPKKDVLGGSEKGQALLNLLNYLMNITVNDAAPNDRWSTAGNMYVNEAYKRMTQLTTLSSYNVQVMLGFILKLVNQNTADAQANKMVNAITNMIIESCDPETTPDIANGIIKLKSTYQGFPADIKLPEGAARIKWDTNTNRFIVPDKQEYGNNLNVTSVNDYVYPMNLQYQVFSDIVTSDSLVIFKGGTTEADASKYKNWNDLINNGYEDSSKEVKGTTQSVAMVKQVEYAVGRLAIRSRLGDDAYIPDAKGNYVYVGNEPFTLKGYVIGSQREVDYDFQPVTSSKTFAIYDTDINGGPQALKRHYFSETDYVLGLGTPADQVIMVALELVNNGPNFEGADGVIVTGATFYLVANLNPKQAEGSSYDPGRLDKVFIKDRSTMVNITINSLGNATYGLPNLDIPVPTVGLSVDLRWEEGLWFPDIPL